MTYTQKLEQALKFMLENATFQNFSFTTADGSKVELGYDRNTKIAIAAAEEALEAKFEEI